MEDQLILQGMLLQKKTSNENHLLTGGAYW